MKSINIVYKKPAAYRDTPNFNEEKPDLRKTINNYYTKTLEKVANREPVSDRMRTQTARSTREAGRDNVISSLSIASITPPHSAVTVRNPLVKKFASQSIFKVKKGRKINPFEFRLPQSEEPKLQTPLFRKSLKQAHRHSKMKPLSKIRCQKDATLVLSIDFIYNEYNFWGDQSFDETSINVWRLLSPLANLVWIVRTEDTYKKLLDFTQSKSLRLDGVLLIESHRKESLMISYADFESSAKIHRGHKVLIINCLKCSTLQNVGEIQFRNTLPVISHPATFVHYVLVDISSRNRMRAVKKIVSKQLPQPYDMSRIFEQNASNKEKSYNPVRPRLQLPENEPQNEKTGPEESMEAVKENLLNYFSSTFGLRTRLDGDSLAYVIGDMVKRNYSIARQFYSYCSQAQQRKSVRPGQLSARAISKISRLRMNEYDRPVFIWDA